MDMGLFRGIITAALFVLFIGLWFWSWSKKRDQEFSDAAQLPLEEGDRPPATEAKQEQRQ